MSKMKIAIQGELGAYSHIAVEKLYKDAEIKTCATFEDTFKQAFEDSTYKIVIPIFDWQGIKFIRSSTQIYNDSSDIDLLMRALKSVL